MVSGSELSNLFCCRVFWGHPVAPCSTFFKAATRELFYCLYSARVDSLVSCILLQQAKVFSLQHILRLSQERFSLPQLCSVFLWLGLMWSLCSFHSLRGLLFLKDRSPDCSVSTAAYLLEPVWLERQYSWKICCSRSLCGFCGVRSSDFRSSLSCGKKTCLDRASSIWAQYELFLTAPRFLFILLKHC